MRVICLLLLVLLASGQRVRSDLINGIYVIVNDAVITFQEVEMAIAPAVELLASQYRNQPQAFEQRLQQVRSEKVQELVERQLILHEFKTAGYHLPESVIDDVLKERIRQRFGDRATLTRTLQAQGISYETFRQQQREQFIVDALRSKNVAPDKVLISPHKIESYYDQNRDKFKVGEQVKLRLIVLNKGQNDGGAARKLAQEILSKIASGASFAEMASIYSDDSQRARGGDRGWVDRSYLREELANVAFSLKPGQHSDVIELPEACYLLFVDDAKAAHIRPLAEVRDEIEKTLKTEEHNRLYSKWIERLKNKSFVRYF